jgi:uncharacterized protein YqfA (UPF0365 family)
MTAFVLAVLIIGCVIAFMLFITFIPVRHWIAAISANVRLSIFSSSGCGCAGYRPTLLSMP